MTLQSDNLGNIVLNGKAIDLTSRGLNHIYDIMEEALAAARQKALVELRKHYERDPSAIPAADEIQQSSVIGVRGWPQ